MEQRGNNSKAVCFLIGHDFLHWEGTFGPFHFPYFSLGGQDLEGKEGVCMETAAKDHDSCPISQTQPLLLKNGQTLWESQRPRGNAVYVISYN